MNNAGILRDRMLARMSETEWDAVITVPTARPGPGSVVSVTGPTVSGSSYSAAQMRTITTALDLFGEHGVSGTSLQMIADALGVTKAAVYHQFRTKEEIVLAVTDVELGALVAALDAAEAEPSPLRAREALLTEVIDLAVKRRRWVRFMQNDPVIIRLLGNHTPFLQLMDRLYGLLLGEDPEHRIAGGDGDRLRRRRRRRRAPPHRRPRRRHAAQGAVARRPPAPRLPARTSATGR